MFSPMPVLMHYVIERPKGSCGVCDIPEVFLARTTVDCLPPITGREKLGRALLLIPLGNTFVLRQLREQRLEKCGLCPITLHFSRPLIGGRQATVVQQKKKTDLRIFKHPQGFKQAK